MGGSAFKVDGECFDDIGGEFVPVELRQKPSVTLTSRGQQCHSANRTPIDRGTAPGRSSAATNPEGIQLGAGSDDKRREY